MISCNAIPVIEIDIDFTIHTNQTDIVVVYVFVKAYIHQRPTSYIFS